MSGGEKTFPVLFQGGRWELRTLEKLCPRTVPWAFVAPHEARAKLNHDGQTLERLAERGGLSPAELVHVLQDKAWGDACRDDVRAIPILLELLRKWADAGVAAKPRDAFDLAAGGFMGPLALVAPMTGPQLAEARDTLAVLLRRTAEAATPKGMSDGTISRAIDQLEQLISVMLETKRAQYEHLATMPGRMRELFGDVDATDVWRARPEKREKLMRWIGFMQGALWMDGAADLEMLKRMVMPPAAEYDENRDKVKL